MVPPKGCMALANLSSVIFEAMQEPEERTGHRGRADDPLGGVDVSLAVGVDVDDGKPAQVDDEILLQALHLLIRRPPGLPPGCHRSQNCCAAPYRSGLRPCSQRYGVLLKGRSSR